MKATKDRLSYWKGRKIDAQAACKQAQEHYQAMLRCTTYAIRKVNQLERQILLIALLFAIGFVHGCQTIQGAARDVGSLCRAIDRSILDEPDKEIEVKE